MAQPQPASSPDDNSTKTENAGESNKQSSNETIEGLPGLMDDENMLKLMSQFQQTVQSLLTEGS